MLSRTLRAVFICVVVLLVIAIPAIGSSSARVDRSLTTGIDPRLQKIAQATGHDAAHLQFLSEAPVQLLNGKVLTRYKALDVKTTEIVGATLDGDQVVDDEAELAAAGQQWRAAHGALTPETVKKLEGLRPDDKLNIAVWLVADVQPLPKADHIYSDTSGPFSTEKPDAQTAAPGASADKSPARPVLSEQIPPEVKAQLLAVLPGSPVPQPDLEKSSVQNEPAVDHAASAAQLEQAQAFHQRNTESLRAQLAPVSAHFLELMHERGLEVQYASETVPMAAMNGVTRAQVEELAFLPEIDAIYVVPDKAGPSLANARPTQNADLINSVGYDGSGVKVSVTEGDRAFFANPYLSIADCYNCSAPYQLHPTAVSGIIRSTAPGFNGLANGVTLYNANGSYLDWPTMSAAMDWGAITATVLNNSWFWDTPNTPTFWEADRHQDYFVRNNYDFVAVAAGNFGNLCGYDPGDPSKMWSNYVVSPAKGYNVMSVGNYEDSNTLGWSDDLMDTCSSYGDPGSDTASPTHAKPEVSAVGSTISSTTTSSPWIGDVGSGTSYSSPMVASLAADLIEASPALANRPEALRSIIMATALHNIEGAAKYSDVDGAGGIDASAAAVSAENGYWDDRSVSSSTTFPITFTVFARQNERVRFVINWLSNPDASDTSDPLPADLDLMALRADGTTVVDYSTSSNNNFEMVDFTAPAAEMYYFRVSKFSFTGSPTLLGSAWWRGPHRIPPDAGFADPQAKPMGTHLVVYPADWPHDNFWRALGIRSPSDTDHDLSLYNVSWFDDPITRTYVSDSSYGAGYVDFVAVDGNRRGTTPEFYRVYNVTGSSGYSVNWSSLGQALYYPGWYGPYNVGATEAVKVFDVWFYSGQTRRISIVPTGSNSTDLGMALYQSNPSDSSTWARRRSQSVAASDVYTSTSATEHLVFTNRLIGAWQGLVVFNNNSAAGQFYVVVQDLVYLPLLMKQ